MESNFTIHHETIRNILNFALISVRKFRNKIKEWKFEKYLSAEESRFIAMKAKAREKEGKDTTFFKNGIRIDQKRIGKSIKRTRDDFEELDAFTAGTFDGMWCFTGLIFGYSNTPANHVPVTALRAKR
jgi:hypothetical protein